MRVPYPLLVTTVVIATLLAWIGSALPNMKRDTKDGYTYGLWEECGAKFNVGGCGGIDGASAPLWFARLSALLAPILGIVALVTARRPTRAWLTLGLLLVAALLAGSAVLVYALAVQPGTDQHAQRLDVSAYLLIAAAALLGLAAPMGPAMKAPVVALQQ